METELLVQAGRLVGGSDAVLVIDDTAIPKTGAHKRDDICYLSSPEDEEARQEFLGYKTHVNADAKHKLIRRSTFTTHTRCDPDAMPRTSRKRRS